MSEIKRPWRPHFIIRERADWLRDVMASDLGAPAKVAAYALCTHLYYKTLSAQVGQDLLARDAGMSVRRLRAALATLADEGWLEVKGGGRRDNTYRAIERSQLMGTETASQRDACEDGFGQFVRTVSVGGESACEDGFGRLSGRFRSVVRSKSSSPIQYSNQWGDPAPSDRPNEPEEEGAPSGARPTPTGGSLTLASADRARARSPDIPPFDGTKIEAPKRKRRTINYRAVLAQLDEL